MSAEYSLADVLAVVQASIDRCDCRPGVDSCTRCDRSRKARAFILERIKADESAVPVAEVYERPVHHDLHNSPMVKDIRFTGMPLPIGAKLYANPHSPDAAETTNPSEISSKLVGTADTLSKPPRLGGCCCGEPCTLGVVHRTDGPCFVYEQPADSGRVADASKLLLDVRSIYIGATRPTGDGCDAETWDRIESAIAAQGQGEAVAWLVTRGNDRTFPHVYISESSADAVVEWVTLPPFANKVPLYTAPPSSPAGVPDVVEQIAAQWDGCMYDAVGETLDIGECIRAAGKLLSTAPSAPEGGEVGL